MKLQISLDKKSINKALKEIEKYKQSLADKRELFLERLLDVGISVAEEHRSGMGKYILFRKEVTNDPDKSIGVLIGENRQTIKSEWKTKEGTKTAELSPILFAEFGSGFLAEVLFDNVEGVGQGTFPGQTHAFDDGGWWWMGMDDEWHHSYGFKPTHPMYNAEVKMLEQIETIAREVFQ